MLYKKLLSLFHQYTFIIYTAMLMMMAGSCTKFVVVQPPQSKLLKSEVFESATTATAAMAGVYSMIMNNGYFAGGFSSVTQYWSDDLVAHGAAGSSGASNVLFYTNSIASNSELSQLWNSPYTQLYNLNGLIEGVGQSTKIDAASKDALLGQAYFLRAYIYFHLVNCFGAIPYLETTDYESNSRAAKLPVEKVFENVLDDLQEAISRLKDTYPTTERIFPNRFAAKALKARVLLHTGDWVNAAKSATDVINHSQVYKLENDLTKVFLKDSREAIWQLKPFTPGATAREATLVIRSAPVSSGVSMPQNLYESFEPNDLRFRDWVGVFTQTISQTTLSWPYCHKYKNIVAGQTDPNKIEYSVIIRLPEMYLIRAEAYAQLENFEDARKDLDSVRVRAGLLPTTANTKEDLLNAVLNERRHELFNELNHRFFDLKRMGRINEILSQTKTTWKAAHEFFPIPEKDVLINPNLGN